MMVCPSCQQGQLKEDDYGYLCDFCGEFFTEEELIIYDQEANEKEITDERQDS